MGSQPCVLPVDFAFAADARTEQCREQQPADHLEH